MFKLIYDDGLRGVRTEKETSCSVAQGADPGHCGRRGGGAAGHAAGPPPQPALQIRRRRQPGMVQSKGMTDDRCPIPHARSVGY